MLKEEVDWGIAKSSYETESGQCKLWVKVIAGMYRRIHKGKSRLCFTFQVTCSELAPATQAQEHGAMVAILTQIFPHLAAVEANHVSGMVRKGVKLRTPSWLSKVTTHPHLEGFVQFWSLHFWEIVEGLEKSDSIRERDVSLSICAEEQLWQGGV